MLSLIISVNAVYTVVLVSMSIMSALLAMEFVPVQEGKE